MKYAFAIGRIRVKEARMLDSEKVTRMIEAKDFEAAFAILNETSYAINLGRLSKPFDFEELFNLELKSLKDFFDEIAPKNEIVYSLWQKYDFHNLKVLLKAKYLGSSPAYLTPAANEPIDVLRNFIMEGIGEIGEPLKTSAKVAIDAYTAKNDPQIIDISLDKYYYSMQRRLSLSCKVPFFKKLVESYIDLINIKTFLRMRELKGKPDSLRDALIDGGLIRISSFIEFFEKPLEEFIQKIKFTPYSKVVALGIDFYIKNKSFCLIEKLVDEYLLEHLRKAKYITFGIEPLIGYMLAKEAEIKTIRMILICKLNMIEIGSIKERLRIGCV